MTQKHNLFEYQLVYLKINKILLQGCFLYAIIGMRFNVVLQIYILYMLWEVHALNLIRHVILF